MNFEKRYREAMGRAKKYMQDGRMTPTKTFAEYIFPELRESEDERIRKALVRFHKSTIDVNGIKGEDIVAWLEKQGKQKPAWSEEDEHRVNDTIYFLDTAKKHYASTIELDACIDWLKSFKERI